MCILTQFNGYDVNVSMEKFNIIEGNEKLKLLTILYKKMLLVKNEIHM